MSKSQESLKITPTSNRYVDMYNTEKEKPLDPKDLATPEEVNEIFKDYRKNNN